MRRARLIFEISEEELRKVILDMLDLDTEITEEAKSYLDGILTDADPAVWEDFIREDLVWFIQTFKPKKE